MFATRDQENLVHAHQTAAASKPLNQQTIRSFAPKTLGNKAPKTPFRVGPRDENDPLGVGIAKGTVGKGKGFGKGNENITLNTQKKSTAGIDRNTFVTPLGPSTRAPLGAKTTNAKAKAFQTPGLQDTNKPQKTAKKLSTTKKAKRQLVIPTEESLEAVPDVLQIEQERDIEYCPPRAIPLRDEPDDLPYDQTFPQFKGANLTRGWNELGKEKVGEDGLTDSQRRYKKESDEFDRRMEAEMQRSIENMELLGINVRAYPDEPCIEEQLAMERQSQKSSGPISSQRPKMDTLRSKSAAAALAESGRKTVKPRTVTVPKARVTALPAKKPSPVSGSATVRPLAGQHAVASATSKTTVGYSKGRRVSNTLKRSPLSASTFQSGSPSHPAASDKTRLSPAMYIQLYGVPPIGSDMWYRCHDAGCFDSSNDDEIEADLKKSAPPPLFDDADDGFQLAL